MASLFLCVFLVFVISGISTGDTASLDQFELFKPPGTNCRLNNIRTIDGASQEQCASECLTEDLCIGFVHMNLDAGNKCYLKRKLENDVSRVNSNVYIRKFAEEIIDDMYLPGFECKGNELYSTDDVTFAGCSAKCLSEKACNGVVFVFDANLRETRPPCTLKTKTCINSDVVQSAGVQVFMKIGVPRGYDRIFKESNGKLVVAPSAVLRTLNGATFTACKAACDKNPRCTIIQYTYSVAVPSPVCVIGSATFTDGGYDASRVMYEKQETPTGYSLRGYDVACPDDLVLDTRKRAQIEWCTSACDATPGCSGITWLEQEEFNCKLNSAECSASWVLHRPGVCTLEKNP